MKLSVFIGKFLLYLTAMFILGIPAIKAYISSPSHALNAFDFFTFYLPMNLIPFIALIMATPLDNIRRLRFIAIGSLAIFLFSVLVIWVQLTFRSVELEMFYVYAIGRIAFPFLLWFGFTYKDLDLQ